jgi:hypothetical protein
MSGGFVEGHVPVSALDEMLRVTKKGILPDEHARLLGEYRVQQLDELIRGLFASCSQVATWW